jgi:hypothetical protein
VVGFSCLFYLLASIARSRGKVIEERLISNSGGWPSTIVLRHRDTTVDRLTKARYHQRLADLCPDLRFPSPDEEAAAPSDADAVYRSATKRLIELRRGAEYQMLHRENASYGFRRNALGLKPVSIAITLLVMAVTAIIWWRAFPADTLTGVAASADVARRWYVYGLFAVDLAYIGIWVFVIRPEFVAQAGREYAEALFRTLERR